VETQGLRLSFRRAGNFFLCDAFAVAENFLQLGLCGRVPLLSIISDRHQGELSMTFEGDSDNYYRALAETCRNSARGFGALNPVLAELYRTAAEVWERLRFTSG